MHAYLHDALRKNFDSVFWYFVIKRLVGAKLSKEKKKCTNF